ncbi:MAG: ribosomal L7Ae/L30e/S12e/Gadd45 family protein [Clostridium argentinense]|uniref:Ribosomal L7Ae/L30e/S12e/Gadd45 family protein n=1 Tax=Clostridium faecium TaxID=2762223 RepID=A0ABR8YV21_9CLOT|nr:MULTISPECIES: ribosomal L7Ae/L30e/S12e/Gadd45 family protein [Clostridium]MBD8048104.1 ribosomal L7Ae/L30e/S12e/Gadd45 family protein [Clostridium faecium]MBS5823745.1 ribosomal L7Ae/L30e/S12e/Gadd45 family protein [Clostridium argentinense]MDU1348163.1 ribosomal L7Ae/L30e/S12e/Gadd45 family protein [Clostridium argentinense]
MTNKFYQFLGLTKKSGNLIEGYNKCEEAIKKQKVYLVILSLECSENTKDKFKKYCNDREIPLLENLSKSQLGISLGREEINVLCVKNKAMSEKLISLWQ